MYITAAMNHSWNEEKSGKSARLFNDRCCLHSKITSSQLRSTCRRVTAEHSQSKLVTTISTSMYVSVWCQSSCPKRNFLMIATFKKCFDKKLSINHEDKNGHCWKIKVILLWNNLSCKVRVMAQFFNQCTHMWLHWLLLGTCDYIDCNIEVNTK